MESGELPILSLLPISADNWFSEDNIQMENTRIRADGNHGIDLCNEGPDETEYRTDIVSDSL